MHNHPQIKYALAHIKIIGANSWSEIFWRKIFGEKLLMEILGGKSFTGFLGGNFLGQNRRAISWGKFIDRILWGKFIG